MTAPCWRTRKARRKKVGVWTLLAQVGLSLGGREEVAPPLDLERPGLGPQTGTPEVPSAVLWALVLPPLKWGFLTVGRKKCSEHSQWPGVHPTPAFPRGYNVESGFSPKKGPRSLCNSMFCNWKPKGLGKTWTTWTLRLGWSRRTPHPSPSFSWPRLDRRRRHGPVTSAR